MVAVLMICSGGGHLKQLHQLSKRFGIDDADQTWVTFRNGLSESLLADREVIYVPFTAPRDIPNFLRTRRMARSLLRRRRFDLAISTGSSPALAFLPYAARSGARAYYIESAARAAGASLTGRIIASRYRLIRTYTQYPGWADERWSYRGSVFDSFTPGPARPRPAAIRRAVVSIGTQEGYNFDRLFAAVVPLLANCTEVLWQTADQDLSGYGIPGRSTVPHDELRRAIDGSDVVIAHAGVGAALTALEAGKCPILIPRRASHGEHVDDHQVQIAVELDRRNLALHRAPDELTADDLLSAAARTTIHVDDPPPIDLDQRVLS